MNEDDYYTHVPLNVVGSLRAITPERLAQLLKAEADLAAARALLKGLAWITPEGSLARKRIDAALAGKDAT